MRRLATGLLVATCILSLPNAACKKKKRRSSDRVSQTGQPGQLASMIQVADPRAQPQLIKGFHQVEHNAWRWTEGSFSAVVRPPLGAGQKGALLVLKFAIPELVVQQLKSIRLSASVRGLALPSEEYSKPGEYTYSREVPPTVLGGEAVSVDFTLDKVLPPNPADARALGVVVSAIGFEAK